MAEAVTPPEPEPQPEASAPLETSAELVPARPAVEASAATRAERARGEAYRKRFAVIYFVLAVISGAAVGSFIVLEGKPVAKKAPKWSAFAPTGTFTARLFQIADTIPRRYRDANDRQLVAATVSSPQQQTSLDNNQTFVTLPLARIEIYDRGNITTAPASGGIQFTLCGDGSDCELKTGKPSQARYNLIEREALELSLYSFRYVNGLGSVTVLLPPSHPVAKPSQVTQTALFLQRKDVLRQLSEPLDDTLGAATPRVGKLSTRDLAVLRSIAIPHTYEWSVAQAQDGAFVRQLQPVG